MNMIGHNHIPPYEPVVCDPPGIEDRFNGVTAVQESATPVHIGRDVDNDTLIDLVVW